MPDASDQGESPPPRVIEPSSTLPHNLLVVEDEVLLTIDLEELLQHLGVASVRAAASVAQAMRAIDERIPDFALLDVTLGTETSVDVARRLQGLGIPFAFVTGHGNDLPLIGEFSNVPKIRKPYSREILRVAISHASSKSR
jgi:DNA-binding NtrC family response regulator